MGNTVSHVFFFLGTCVTLALVCRQIWFHHLDGICRHTWEDLKQTRWHVVGWIHLAENTDLWASSCEHGYKLRATVRGSS